MGFASFLLLQGSQEVYNGSDKEAVQQTQAPDGAVSLNCILGRRRVTAGESTLQGFQGSLVEK